MNTIRLLVDTGEDRVVDDAAFAEEIRLERDRVDVSRDTRHLQRHTFGILRIEREALERNGGKRHAVERREELARSDVSSEQGIGRIHALVEPRQLEYECRVERRLRRFDLILILYALVVQIL